MPTQQPLVVDVRSPAEFANGHVAGAINLPLSELAERVTSVLPQRDAPLVLCCVSGARSDVAAQWLRAQGYTQVANGGSAGAVALQLGLPIERA